MDQKIPKPKRLQEWYRKMLDKAVAERIVHDFKVKRLEWSLRGQS
jgi:E1A/CREB-binding protein